MASDKVKERAVWLAFAVLFFIVTSVSGYVITGLENAKDSVHKLEDQNEVNKIQWQKISLMREDYWKAQVAQAYRNGCMETAIKYIHKGIRF